MIITYKNFTPQISSSTFVAPNTIIIGNCTFAENTSVWFGTTIRADCDAIKIGRNSNIQENCVLHVDDGEPIIMGENVTVGHGAILHGCTIGNNSLIGIGATVLGRAVIGNNVIIGAGALVPPGKVIPDNSLVMGIPSTIVRKLSEEDLKIVTASAEHYVEKSAEYARILSGK
ncbi:gamma carbonic anhydrase family protein [Desulfovibrio sp. OttesenSCG-928-C06]|nr:gamma carbonic anhydrase family protein [Desulfovibrio sp. OttesenSCG-928-C06]